MIVSGRKDVENRFWRTTHRGRLLIHASRTLDDEAMRRFGFRDLPTGGIVGECVLVGCVERSDSPWFEGPYGFALTGARRLPFVALPGRQGIFLVPARLVTP